MLAASSKKRRCASVIAIGHSGDLGKLAYCGPGDKMEEAMSLVVKYGTDLAMVKGVERFRALTPTEKKREREKRKKPDGREAAGK